jgi:hypothetical protein
MMIENIKGNYAFIRGIGPFSSALVARPGFEIVHAGFRPFVPLTQGYAMVERHLRDLVRPISALCGMQLRIPEPLSREAFEQFNRPYLDKLNSWELEVDGANPVTRTNVSLEVNPVAEPMLAGFFYTVPSDAQTRTWVLSGAPEIATREGGVKIVARGDTSAEGMRKKAECVMRVLGAHLAEMGLNWNTATAVNLYTVHNPHPIMASTLIASLGTASQVGINWHYSRPPVKGLELEIDAYAVRQELNLML